MATPIDEAAARAAIGRCRRISWRQDTARLGSQAALMREFLRRAARLSETLAGNTDWRWDDFTRLLPLPGIDRRFLPAYVFLDDAPPYERPGADPLEDEVIALSRDMTAGGFDTQRYGRKACWWYIRWASVKALPAVAALALPDPYEPLILFYERGGWFQREQGYLDLNGVNVSLLTYKDRPSLALAPGALDALDVAAGNAAGGGE